jgi:hypothetical protein
MQRQQLDRSKKHIDAVEQRFESKPKKNKNSAKRKK